MSSQILRAAVRMLMPLLLLFALFLLFRGHNQPGGGFVAGLIVAAAFALHGIAFGVSESRKALIVEPPTLLRTGLLVALLSGIPGLLMGQPFLTGVWGSVGVAIGTPLVFDVGVFLVVVGVVLTMTFTLAES